MQGGKKPGAGSPFPGGMPGIGGGAAKPRYQPSGITPTSELSNIGQGIKNELTRFVPTPIQEMLQIKPTDTEEEIAKKKAHLDKYNKLTDAEKQVADQLYQQQKAKEQQQTQEKARQAEAEREKYAQNKVAPEGKKSGFDPQGSTKAKVTQTFNHNRNKPTDPI